MNLLSQIEKFIQRESLLTQGSRVIVGLSGGADSVSLLSILTSLGYECIAVHCHFGLRGEEADHDAAHSESIASGLGIPFKLVKFNTQDYAKKHRLSIEMACRELRYHEFERLRQELDAEAIAVGHHREDNVETMLLNLLRGCGIHGVRGMLPSRDHIVRPLLETPRAELISYLEENNLDYVIDSSNLENDFKRNRLRNIIIPAILDAFPDALTSLSVSIKNLRECDELYSSLLPPRSDSLKGVSSTLLHEWLAPFGFNSAQCRDILSAETGAAFHSKTHYLTICSGNRYELGEISEINTRPKLKVETYPALKPFNPKNGHLYLDADALPHDMTFELTLWSEGDRMRPFGMNGYRMVADVMNDCGISATARRSTWLLRLGNDILWIVGHRASALYPITDKTENITEISIDHENI